MHLEEENGVGREQYRDRRKGAGRKVVNKSSIKKRRAEVTAVASHRREYECNLFIFPSRVSQGYAEILADKHVL